MPVKAKPKPGEYKPDPVINIKLTSKQQQVLMTPATEIFYGGAAGGGKSLLLRFGAIYYGTQIPHLQIYLFRRLSPDLKKNHMDGITGFRALLEPWERNGLVEITENEIRFWNQSKIHLCHCQEEKDKYKYQGAEINLLLIDELTHFSESIYRFLRGRCRLGSLGRDLPKQYRTKFPLIIAASNPGNVGHEWVKETFVDPAEEGKVHRAPDSEGGKLRIFIKSTLEDNPYLEADYARTLEGLGTEDLVRAMKHGDWNVLMGSFFSNFSVRRNMIAPFSVPVHWPRVVGLDWGRYYPFCVEWWTVAQEDFKHPYEDRVIPFGSPVCYRQWYGEDRTKGRNRGLALTPEEVADGIFEREAEYEGPNGTGVDYRVADPAIWKSDTGLSVGVLFQRKGIKWSKGENAHDVGWDVVNDYIGKDSQPTSIFWFNTCYAAKRNFTSAVRDEKNPMQIKAGCEIHSCDTCRYVVMRIRKGLPAVDRRKAVPAPDSYKLTYGHMLAAAEAEEAAEPYMGPLE